MGTYDTLAVKVFPTSTTRLVLLSQEETTLLIWKGDKLSRSVNEEDLQPKPDSDEIESHQEKRGVQLTVVVNAPNASEVTIDENPLTIMDNPIGIFYPATPLRVENSHLIEIEHGDYKANSKS